jgi:hypothetical protein
MSHITVPLREIAYARSGDKGSSANIGVIAYTEEGFLVLKDYLTEEKVGDFFKSLKPSRVIRYELQNLGALNFVLVNVLAGGGSKSLRIDSQGKVLGQVLLEMTIEISEEILPKCRGKQGVVL